MHWHLIHITMWIIRQLLGIFGTSFNGRRWDIFLLEPASAPLAETNCGPRFLWESWGRLWAFYAPYPKWMNIYGFHHSLAFQSESFNHGQMYLFFGITYYFGAMFKISLLALVFCSFHAYNPKSSAYLCIKIHIPTYTSASHDFLRTH